MPPGDEHDEERREAQRHKSFKGASIVFNNRNSVVTGVVKDLSPAGAKFIVSAPVDLPKDAQFRFPNGEEQNIEVMWHQGKTRFGLRFKDSDKG